MAWVAVGFLVPLEMTVAMAIIRFDKDIVHIRTAVVTSLHHVAFE